MAAGNKVWSGLTPPDSSSASMRLSLVNHPEQRVISFPVRNSGVLYICVQGLRHVIEHRIELFAQFVVGRSKVGVPGDSQPVAQCQFMLTVLKFFEQLNRCSLT